MIAALSIAILREWCVDSCVDSRFASRYADLARYSASVSLMMALSLRSVLVGKASGAQVEVLRDADVEAAFEGKVGNLAFSQARGKNSSTAALSSHRGFYVCTFIGHHLADAKDAAWIILSPTL